MKLRRLNSGHESIRGTILAMNSPLATVIALASLVPVAFGQRLQSKTSAHPTAFHWNAKSVQTAGWTSSLRRNKSLTSAQKSALVRVLAPLIKADLDGPSHSEEEWQALTRGTRIALVDLNGDGEPEVVAQAPSVELGCGATGNCPFWVFQRAGATYKLILHANGIQNFTVQPTLKDGFHDLVLGSHMSASEQYLVDYRYMNGSYREGPCHDANWEVMDDKGMHELKHPLISQCEPRQNGK